MRVSLNTRLSDSTSEQLPKVRIYLPHAECRSPTRAAMAIARGLQREVRAYSFRQRGDHLPAELRRVLYGADTSTPAERALRHLIDSAQVGAHLAINPAQGDLSGPAPELVIIGWDRNGALPARGDVREVAAQGAPVLLLSDRADRGIERVLIVSTVERNSPCQGALQKVTGALERSYGIRSRRAVDIEGIRAVVSAANEHTLTLLAIDSSLGFGWLEGPETLAQLPGSAGVLVHTPQDLQSAVEVLCSAVPEDP